MVQVVVFRKILLRFRTQLWSRYADRGPGMRRYDGRVLTGVSGISLTL